MKFYLTLLFSLSIFVSLVAQSSKSTYKINGQAIEKSTGKGIPYATVILQGDSAKEKKAMASDGSGNFAFVVKSPQKYTLTISAVGYTAYSAPVDVTTTNTELGKLVLEEGIELKEVSVTAQKPLVKVDVDKIVYSMESDPESQTNNALDMFRKVPLVTVDADENISLNGQSNFKVLINGKSSSMVSNNLKDVLKSFPANTIKDVEVITNPSSKYDSEGVGGIINIITIKKTFSGYNGSISTGINSRGNLNASTYLSAKINKFGFSTRISGSQFKQPKSESFSNGEYFNNDDFHYTQSTSSYNYKGSSYNFSGEASYDIDSLNLISMSFWGYYGLYDINNENTSEYRDINQIESRNYITTGTGKTKYGSLSGNIDYQKTFKKPDKSLTFSYKLDNEPELTRNSTVVTGITNYQSYAQRTSNDATGREQTLQFDYYDPLTKMHQIEGGFKFILRQNISKSENYRDEVVMNNNNDLDYDQYILGAYAGYVFKWKKISTKSGLRLERTWNNGVSKFGGTTTDFKNRLFNLVPYITISFMPKQGQTIRTSYTQRLSRPGIWYLNPYVNNTDSMNMSQGNPSLESELSHSFELGYSFFAAKFNISATSSAAFINNSIEYITTIQPNGSRYSTYKNIGKNQNFGLNIYTSYRPNPKINIYFNGGGYYSKYEANASYALSNEGFSYRGSIGMQGNPWKNGSVNIYGYFYSPSVRLQGKSSSYFYSGLSISQYLLDRKLQFSVSVSDPFTSKRISKSTSLDPTFYIQSESRYYSRTVGFSITYRFGNINANTQVKKARRGIQNDDLKSGGSSQGQSGGN